jgi:hypothetical protein
MRKNRSHSIFRIGAVLFVVRRHFMESSYLKGVERRERIKEWYRLKFRTHFTTLLIGWNVLFLLPLSLISWFTVWYPLPLPILVDMYEISWTNFFVLWNIPLFTWWYSTITFPIKKGYKTLIDWSKTKKGRILSLVLNIVPFIFVSWIAACRYMMENYVPFLKGIKVDEMKFEHLLTHDFNSLIIAMNFIPLIATIILLIVSYRHYHINKNILEKNFMNWELPWLTRYAYELEMDQCDVIIGFDASTKKPIVIKEDQRFLHELVTGATGTGKTSTTILMRIVQDLIKIATGRRKLGLVFLEPKGDGVEDVLKIAKKLGIPDEKIRVVDPTRNNSTKFNPFIGPDAKAAEGFRGTLNALTGDQEAFFKGQQEETAALFTLLAKLRYGNLTNITHIQRLYSDPRYLADITEFLREKYHSNIDNPSLTEEERKSMGQIDNILRYFEDDVLDYKTYRQGENILPLLYSDEHRHAGKQIVENKKEKYVAGAKKYLNDISVNAMLSFLMTTTEDDKVLDLDEFLCEGGILLVNTALAELEELSIFFGQFFIRQFQSAVFRRPKEERHPVYFYVDEFPLYVNESFERMLTLGRSYKVGSLIAIQSLGQLDKVVRGYKETILSNASSKTVFGRGTVQDNKHFSEEFGEHQIVEESLNESTTPITTENQSWGYRYNSQVKDVPRFSPTEIKELPFKHMIVQVVEEDGSISISAKAFGQFVSEAKFLKKYLKLNEKLKSEEENAFSIDSAISSAKYNVDLDSKSPTVEDLINGKYNSDTKETVHSLEDAVDEKPPEKDSDSEQENVQLSFTESRVELEEFKDIVTQEKVKQKKTKSPKQEESGIQTSLFDNTAATDIEGDGDSASIPDNETDSSVDSLVQNFQEEIAATTEKLKQEDMEDKEQPLPATGESIEISFDEAFEDFATQEEQFENPLINLENRINNQENLSLLEDKKDDTSTQNNKIQPITLEIEDDL